MALKEVTGKGSNRAFLKLTELEVGESVNGFLLAVTKSTSLDNAYSLVMQINDEEVTVNTAGNVKYRAQDGDLAIGQYTEITRKPDTKNSKGKKQTDYAVLQDDENTIEVPEKYKNMTFTPAAAGKPSPSVADKINAMKEGNKLGRQ